MDFGRFYMHTGNSHMYKKLGQSTIELEYTWKIWFNLIKKKKKIRLIHIQRYVISPNIFWKTYCTKKHIQVFLISEMDFTVDGTEQ